MMSTFSIYLAGFAMLALARCQPAPDKVAQRPELERLVQDLIADDAKVATDAQEQLKKTGPEVVPVLFDRLVTSGWDLKPPLLEVLNEHGLDYARLKLFQGTDEEKTYAAILYELIDWDEDTESAEYRAMVEVLLKALKTEDKNLRAAAVVALVHGGGSTLVFEHFHDVVPALISSFDTDLVIGRRAHFDPYVVLLGGIGLTLDGLIGDRFAYLEIQPSLRDSARGIDASTGSIASRRAITHILAAKPQEIQQIKAYWEMWWGKHSKMSLAEIGRLVIGRNLRLLPEREPTDEQFAEWPTMKREEYTVQREQHRRAKGSLKTWSGEEFGTAQEWHAWWAENRETYAGRKRRPKE